LVNKNAFVILYWTNEHILEFMFFTPVDSVGQLYKKESESKNKMLSMSLSEKRAYYWTRQNAYYFSLKNPIEEKMINFHLIQRDSTSYYSVTESRFDPTGFGKTRRLLLRFRIDD